MTTIKTWNDTALSESVRLNVESTWESNAKGWDIYTISRKRVQPESVRENNKYRRDA